MNFERVARYHELNTKIVVKREAHPAEEFDELNELGREFNQVDWCGEWLKLMDRIQRYAKTEEVK